MAANSPPDPDKIDVLSFQGSEISYVKAKSEEQRNNEIQASIRSLKTNLLITFVIIVVAIITDPMPQYAKAYVISFVKAASPVMTMVVNFGKVKEYLNDVRESFRLRCYGNID